MKAYILSIAGIILLSAVFTIVLPGGKMGKFLKGMLKTATILVLLAPFVSWAGGKGFDFQTSDMIMDEKYLAYCAQSISEQDEKEIGAALKNNFGVTVEVSVERDSGSPFSVKKMQIKIIDFGINEENEHIIIVDKIKSTLEKKYGCTAEVA